ncbi:hypothetical protein PVAG01_11135 [Phlyctema vagabunda]|uniref:Uncharacterized protein n=1 Tax=Phlyctema vagabunda TaxID=108571 RepID=A0ABR4P1F1_9HELO
MNGLTYFSNALEKANEYYNAGLDKANEHARPALTQALKKTNKYTPKIVQAQVNRGAKWVQTQRANYEHMKRAEAAWWTRTESLYDTPPADDVFGSDDESKVHEREEARLAREDQKRNPPQDKIFGDPVLVSHEPAQRPTPTAGLWHEIGEAEVKRVKRRAPGSAAVTTRTVTQPQYADASRAYQVRYVTEEKKQRDYIAARSEAEPTRFDGPTLSVL